MNHEKSSSLGWIKSNLKQADQLEIESVIRALSTALNEKTQLPYRFDVIALELTSHKDLLEHIQRFGKVVWRDSNTSP